MTTGYLKPLCYADFTHFSLRDVISLNNTSTLKVALLVAEFAQQMATVYEQFSKEVHNVISTFKSKHLELRKERPTDSPSTILTAWECLLQATEMDAQAYFDAANLLLKNVYRPLEEMATHKKSQTHKLSSFRDQFEETLEKTEKQLFQAEKSYHSSYQHYQTCSTSSRENAKALFHNAHNEYIFQVWASNRTIDEFKFVIPQVLEEIEEIYIDTSNTVNIAIESHALMLLTKANEQHDRYDGLLKICRKVNPTLDIAHFLNSLNPDITKMQLDHHTFHSADNSMSKTLVTNQLIFDRHTEPILQEKRNELQKEASEIMSYIKQNQDIIHSLVNICQRNLANHLYSKVYETQEDMCRKRNEIRLANLQLSAIRAQIEILSPKQNGSMEALDQESKKSSATIKSMWKKAFKSLKSTSEQKLTKRGSLIKKKQNSQEDEVEENESTGEIDPVYSLLKCAADLPKAGKTPCGLHPHCSGHHGNSAKSDNSSTSTSKTTSPSSSASHSPKTRKKKLNSRMKSFSLDTPEPSKHLLAIDENTKRKSSSFTNTCFRVTSTSPVEKYTLSAANLRKKFASSYTKASSLDIEEDKKNFLPSPKPQRKQQNNQMYVVLYNFKGKEKDDLDLRAGWRVNVLDSSDPDWWKGKCNSKTGYFPATYLVPVSSSQRVFQVTQSMHLTEGGHEIKLHKDQIVLEIGDESHGMVHIETAKKKQGVCPLKYLKVV